MIAFLAGRVIEKSSAYVVLDVGGVGYRLMMSTPSLEAMPPLDQEARLHTYLHLRAEEISLFGFASAQERMLFEKLIGVSGVGPKVALAVLSSLNFEMLAGAIANGDVGLIATTPGVGKKTAQRIIIDLKDSLEAMGFSAASPMVAAGAGSAAAEVRDALCAMGFTPSEATAAMRPFSGDTSDSKSWVQDALRRLGGGA